MSYSMDARGKDYRDDEPPFRCPGCEVNTGTGRYCDECRETEHGGEG